jgi:hypothetical protein
MTNLERLIQAHTRASTLTTISAATERVAEELARETVNDPAFRAELRALIRKHFSTTIEQLDSNGRRRRRGRRHARAR